MTDSDLVTQYVDAVVKDFLDRRVAPIIGWLSTLHGGNAASITARELHEGQALLRSAFKVAAAGGELPSFTRTQIIISGTVASLQVQRGAIVHDISLLREGLTACGQGFLMLRGEFEAALRMAFQESTEDPLPTAWQVLRETLRVFSINWSSTDGPTVALAYKRGTLSVDMTALARVILHTRLEGEWLQRMARFEVTMRAPPRLTLVR